MHNLFLFSQTLQISWMRRLASSNGNWISIPKLLGIDNFFYLGDSYAKGLLEKIENPFWRSAVNSVYYTMVNIQPKNADDLQGIPIWHNSKWDNQILPRWMRNGVYMLSDLISANAKILNQSEIELQYGFKTNFLKYGKVKYHVDRYINAYLRPRSSPLEKGNGPVNTFFNRIINIDSKGASKLYKKINSNKVKIFLDITDKWENILNHKSNVNMYMKYIQFRILHYRVSTKSELYKIKIVTSCLLQK